MKSHASGRENEFEAGIARAYQHEKYLIELVKKKTSKTVGELKCEIQTINQQSYQFKSESEKYMGHLIKPYDLDIAY